MFRFNTKKVLALFAVAVLLTLPSQTRAQLSEGEMSRFVPPDTFLFLSINMESLMEQVDGDHEVIKMFRERERFTAADFTETRQYLIVLASNKEETENEFDMPAAIFTRYPDVIDKEAYLKKSVADTFGNLTYESETHGETEVYLGKYGEDDIVSFSGDPPAFFFAADDIVVFSSGRLIKEMIDNENEDTAGKELVGNLNSDAELHFLMEDGSNITAMAFFGFMEEDLNIPGFDARELLDSLERLEIVGDTDQMIPLKAMIEMKSESAAEDVEALIATGLQAVPGLLMMAESELDAAIERDYEEFKPITGTAKSLIELGKKAATDLEVVRDGTTIEIQLGSIEGLDKLPELGMVITAWQRITMEKFMEEIQELDFDLDTPQLIENIEIEDDGDRQK